MADDRIVEAFHVLEALYRHVDLNDSEKQTELTTDAIPDPNTQS